MAKWVIYQVLPRFFGNKGQQTPHGSIHENGCGKFADFSAKALKSIAELGCTHVWYTGILEHATKTDYSSIGIPADHQALVKGKAGSPYAIKDYYDVDPDLAVDPTCRMREFEELIERTHSAGLKVLIDFVPNHLARRYHSDAKPLGIRDFGVDDFKHNRFDPSNNFYYLDDQAFRPPVEVTDVFQPPYVEQPAKATGNDCFSASPGINDWYETVKLNYGVDYQDGHKKHFDPIPATWFKMLDILQFWCAKGVDGFRCDMAEMVPVEFWEWVIARVKHHYPEVTFIAEIYQTHLYVDFLQRGGFDFLYDKEGMYNTLRSVVEGRTSASDITRCWQQTNGFQEKMLSFLENHDEQRIASDFFAANPKKALPAMFVLACYHQNPVLIYAGQELGERGMYAEGFSGLDGRNSIFDYWCVESLASWKNNGAWDEVALTPEQRNLRKAYKQLLNLVSTNPVLDDGAFFDLQYANSGKECYDSWTSYAFLRKRENDLLLGVAHFSDTPMRTSVCIPKHAYDCLSIPRHQTCRVVELFTGKEFSWDLSECHPMDVVLEPFGYALYHIHLNP